MKPQFIKEYSYKYLGDDIFLITAPPLSNHTFLVIGQEKAMLIDTGLGLGSLKAITNILTNLPIVLVNTHGHPDHCGGNAEFETAYMNPADEEVFKAKCSYEARYAELSGRNVPELEKLKATAPMPLPLEDGCEFDLGGRVLKIIFTPGHTIGSICIFDTKSGALFAGDNIMAGATDILEPQAADISQYRDSLKKLSGYDIRTIYAGHSPYEVSPDVIEKKIRCADRILSGEEGEYYKSFRGEGYNVSEDGTGINYAINKRR